MMLEIIEGSLNDLRTEMRWARMAKTDEIKSLRKKLNGVKKLPNSTDRQLKIQNKIDELTSFKNTMLSPSKVLPVWLGAILINYKAYQDFIKKINGLEMRTYVENNCLCIEYYTGPLTKGTIEFFDLLIYYEGFQNIPVAVIQDDDE